MQIVLSKKEIEAGRAFLRAIGPEVEKEMPEAIKNHPLLTPRFDRCHGDVACDISEELVVSVVEMLADKSAVIVPLCKGLYAAAKGTLNEMTSITQRLMTEARERREAADKARQKLSEGEAMMDTAHRELCAAEHPECAKQNGCMEGSCGCHR